MFHRLWAPGSPFVSAEKYRQDIDVLRAFAVVAVVLFHAFPQGPIHGGYLGVDVFFVISGFVITDALRSELGSGQYSVWAFYLRRARRILPAIQVVLIFLAIAWPLQFTLAENIEFRQELASSMLFFANFYFYRAIGYFAVGADHSPLLHFWSLAVEEQFYLSFPLLLLLVAKIGRVREFLLLATIASLAFFLVASFHDPAGAFYLPHTRAWELGLGAVVAYAPRIHLADSPKKWAAGGLCLVLGCAILFGRKANFFGFEAQIIASFATAALIYTRALTVGDHLPLLMLTGKLGLISFPLYLWHWPLLVMLNVSTDGDYLPVYAMLVVLVSLVLAVLTAALEFQVRRRKNNSRIPVGLFAGMVGVGAILWACPSVGLYLGNPSQAEKDMLGYDAARAKLPLCGLEVPQSLTWCFKTGETPKYAVIGDSHADHLFVGLAETGSQWLFMGLNSCPLVSSAPQHSTYGPNSTNYEACRQAMDAMVAIIAKQKSIETVVLASLGPYYIMAFPFAKQHRQLAGLAGRLPEEQAGVVGKDADQIADGLRNTIRALQTAGKRVVLLEDVPELPFSPAACLYRWQIDPNLSGCSVPVALYDKRSAAYRSMLSDIVEEFPAATIIHTKPLFCDDAQCFARRNGRMLYRDSHHLSVFGSELMASYILGTIR
jgi:peptidoglycan/LPS O-acetylase OafA/YrhL